MSLTLITDHLYLAFILYWVVFRCTLVARTQVVLFCLCFYFRAVVVSAAVKWLGTKDIAHTVVVSGAFRRIKLLAKSQTGRFFGKITLFL